MVSDTLTLSEAHMELLDHLGEEVHVGIMLPDNEPWAGGHGPLRHEAQRLIDAANTTYSDDETARIRRRWTELLLQRGGREGRFLIGDFIVPLGAEHTVAVYRKMDGRYPGLDFAIVGDLTVRVTFAEHERHEDEGGES